MVKVLLKDNLDDAGVLAEVSGLDVSLPHVLSRQGVTYARSPVPDSLRLCGSCDHMLAGSLREPAAAGWHCGVDSKDTPHRGTCRNGGFVPAVHVYRRVKVIRVELEAAPVPATPADLPSDEVTVVTRTGSPRLGRHAYAAAALFFLATFMGTIWVLQWVGG